MKKQNNNAAIKAEFTKFSLDDQWVFGKIGDWNFTAKLFDDPSQYGINEGRVSKLEIKNELGATEINYDRGWDIEPNNWSREYFAAVMELLENSARRFDVPVINL